MASMRVDYKKITQIIGFLVASYKEGLPKLKLVKLVWAADRYHLRKYARLVTEDDYFAMKNGPVASWVKDVIEFNTNEFSNLEAKDLEYVGQFIKNENGVISSIAEPDLSYLSETDKEALNFAIKTFGGMSEQELINITHEYPEWRKQSNCLEPPVGNGSMKSKDIDESDFFKDPDEIKNDPFYMDRKNLEVSKKIFLDFA